MLPYVQGAFRSPPPLDLAESLLGCRREVRPTLLRWRGSGGCLQHHPLFDVPKLFCGYTEGLFSLRGPLGEHPQAILLQGVQQVSGTYISHLTS